jgi:hypothetical protein
MESGWLGSAASLTGTLLNSTNDSVNFAIGDGGTFKIFVSDYQSRYLGAGTFTVTVNYSDGSQASASVTTSGTEGILANAALPYNGGSASASSAYKQQHARTGHGHRRRS